MSPLEVIIPITLLFIALLASYKLGVIIERLRTKSIPLWNWSTWFKRKPERK